jgi:hypothetical protein
VGPLNAVGSFFFLTVFDPLTGAAVFPLPAWPAVGDDELSEQPVTRTATKGMQSNMEARTLILSLQKRQNEVNSRLNGIGETLDVTNPAAHNKAAGNAASRA